MSEHQAIRSLSPILVDSVITPIFDGYSNDKKYLIVDRNDKYLLRVFDPSEYAHKQSEFTALRKMEELGVRASRAVEIGLTGATGYMILSFIEGHDLEKALGDLTHENQYSIGLEAGRELLKINQWQATNDIAPWAERKRIKQNRYLKQYLEGDVKFKDADKVISFIEQNIGAMENRPNLFQHDDFHVRNLVVDGKRLSGVIDFGRHDWGDPYHEFLKVGLFSAKVSIPFSVGQIRGYFHGQNPDQEFWTLYSLYLAMSTFSSIVWTKHVCPNEMPDMLRILERVLDDHDSFDRIIPKWFEE